MSWATLFASVGCIGFFPRAPGTVASLAAVILYLALPPFRSGFFLLVACSGVFGAGLYAVRSVLEEPGSRHDPRFIVCDEVLGQWLALWSPGYQASWPSIALSFVLFRLFDIVKPFPASYFDRRTGALAVMMDDVVAGLYATISLHLIFYAWAGV